MSKFYMMGIKCPRFKFLEYHQLIGVEQFHMYRREILYNYIIRSIRGESNINVENERIRNEIASENLDDNLRNLASKISISQEIEFEGEIAYIGKIDEKNAIFNISTSKKWNKTHSMSVIYIMDHMNINAELVATIFPMIPKIKIYEKDGVRTKSGEIDKRDSVGTWENVRSEIVKEVSDYDTFTSFTESVPEPIFGECGICPYHNVTVEFGGIKYFCNG